MKPARSRHCNRGATLIGHGHWLEGEASRDPRARRLASSCPATPGRSTPKRATPDDAAGPIRPTIHRQPVSTPVWMAFPPEVHSALLSNGPGPGPLLVAATAWNAMGSEYMAVAEELREVLAAVQAGAWDGPTAQAYVAAHAPYLAWLGQASAHSIELASRHATAATAYLTAVAAMPTLFELTAHHAAHQVLVATNFLGINTIAISLNEANYVRMWIQAAAVMSTYQTATTASLASAPQLSPAPPIRNSNVPAAAAGPWLPLPADQQNWIYQLLQQIGYLDFYNKFLVPFINLLANNPFLQAMFSGIDPYLLILGNPLTYLNPFNIAFALGYPMDIATYVSLLSETFAFIGMDLAAAFASGNPMAISLTILFVTVEAIGTIITDTIALLKTLLEQTAVFFTIVAPMLLAPLVPLAAGAVLTPLGIKGLAVLTAGAPPALPGAPGVAFAPSLPTSSSTAAPAAVATTTPAPTLGPPTPPATAPPVTGSGLGTSLSAGMENFDYLVGELSTKAARTAGSSTRRKAPEPDEQPRTTASSHRAINSGFAGTAVKTRSSRAAGLRPVPSTEFGGHASAPMLPSTWTADPG